ncbi:hypothetical protein [Nocardioides terrisoli]|uniref:hypothetical protein n=1 Tax=Nocardioides terrisoli TaxID=3388267 RepID=UPI00287B63CC|nr:hypothetical protein [Nocardioides marmorisolisilvae]
MTYGENVAQMREALTSLLGWHRITQRLGGPGNVNVPVTTTTEERRAMGVTINRYRLAVLSWCEQAVTAVTPPGAGDLSAAHRQPTDDLLGRLRQTIDDAEPQPSLLDALAEPHRFELMQTWRQAARAAALGEHDLTADVNRLHLPRAQMDTVLADAGTLARAIAIVDVRYANIPGWTHLSGRHLLERAAEACLHQLADRRLDPGVEQRGRRPPAGIIDGPALPGLAGVNQAQHNMLVDLARHPNALNLRRVLFAQAKLSDAAARHVETAAPELAGIFRRRAGLYREMVHASRDVQGPLGGGGYAVAQAQEAILRLERTHPSAEDNQAEALQRLARLCTKTDARIATTIERGFAEKLYAVPITLPQLDGEPTIGIHAAEQRWIPTLSSDRAPLLAVTRSELRPQAAASCVRSCDLPGDPSDHMSISAETHDIGAGARSRPSRSR